MGRAALLIPLVALACGERSDIGGLGLTPSDASSPTIDVGTADVAATCSDAVLQTAHSATFIAVDGARVLWGTQSGELWGHDASGTNLIVTEPAAIAGIAVNGPKVYFAAGSTIFELDGQTVSPFLGNQGDPLFVEADDQAVYTMDFTHQTVVRIEKDSRLTHQLLSGFGRGPGMTIDATDIYVSTGLGGRGNVMRIFKTVGGGSAIVTVAAPKHVAVNATTLVILDQSNVARVWAANKLGGPTPVLVLAELGNEQLSDLSLDATSAYVTSWVNTTNNGPHSTLRRIALDGSKAEILAQADGVAFNEVCNDATAVYWTSVNVSGSPSAATVQKKCK